MSKIIVLGAGVSGLTTAVLLLQAGHKNVTVIGQYIPGDKTVDYTSPWAGASIMTIASCNDSRLQAIDRDTHAYFKYLADHVPESSVIACPAIQYNEEYDPPGENTLWVRDFYANVVEIPKAELPGDVAFGFTFDNFTLNVPKYLEWLVGRIHGLGGRVLRDHPFASIQQVVEKYKCTTVVNCTGLGAAKLADVKDINMYPIRGQTALVEGPHIRKQYYREAKVEDTYIIPRGDGTVICGGTHDEVNNDLNEDPSVTAKFLERCYKLCPELTYHQGADAIKVISINVGFRPGRKGGIRLEKETRVDASTGAAFTVIHNYGHSSHGYQSSWGSAQRAVKLVNDVSFIAKL